MRRLRHWLRHHITYRWARRLVVGIIGGTVLLVGFALIVLPGPAVIVIPLGLAILSLEFAWARMWLRRVRNKAQRLSDGVRERWSR
jgi:tellurite resistance protein TerC